LVPKGRIGSLAAIVFSLYRACSFAN
jgi:hypothetical protein